MADIINLRTARKARLRADKDKAAADNRAKFGRPKAEQTRGRKDAERLRKMLDQSKIERD